MRNYKVYEGNEIVFETENEDLAFRMASNINEDGGNAFVDFEEEVFETGTVILFQGIEYTVDKVLSAYYEGEEDGWYAEFVDTQGNYHNWKQGIDGGVIIS